MSERIERSGLQVAAEIDAFVKDAALPGTGLDLDAFWAGFAAIVADLAPRNRDLLAHRDELQARIDGWHKAHPGAAFDSAEYKAFLKYKEKQG